MERSQEQINQTEKEYWNERKLDRRKIKPLRRHSFFYSYQRENRILNRLVLSTENKDVLELGSYTWANWIKGRVKPKSLTCINISEEELKNGKKHSEDVNFEINFHLMDANNLTFEDQKFDVVIGGAILHHLDIEKSLHHVYRVLKPGGIIIFLEPLNMNPLYRLYRRLNPQERTPDEHALVKADFKIIKQKFTFEHYFMDFCSVVTGFISLKIFGDKKYNNWLNKLGYYTDVFLSKIPFLYVLFARVIIHGKKKEVS